MRLVLVSGTVCLARLGVCLIGSSHTDVVTLSMEVYDNLKYYVQYSASAYCNSQDLVGAAVTCEGGCTDVMANGATIVGVMP